MKSWKNKKYNKCRFVFLMPIYLNITSWTCFVFKAQPAFADKLHDTLNIRKNDSLIGTAPHYHSKHFKSTPSTEFSSTNQWNANHDETSNFRSNICGERQHQNVLLNKSNLNPTQSGDTNSQDDNVRNQYSSLPYPAVRKDHFLKEQNYYKNDSLRNIPYAIYPPIGLEYINHFLYNGVNDFM